MTPEIAALFREVAAIRAAKREVEAILLSADEAAKRLSVSRHMIMKMVRAKSIPFVDLDGKGKEPRFIAASLCAWAKQQEIQVSPKEEGGDR
jgi:excisionase family DNA binding protein